MIRVNEDYIIEIDAMNYIAKLDKHKVVVDKKTGKTTPVFDTIGYLGTLEGALNKIKDDMIKRKICADVFTIEEAIIEIKNINKDFIDTFNMVMQENK